MPDRAVLAAFGASETPERLVGGRGLAWRLGHMVLRPAGDLEEANWTSEVLANIPSAQGFTAPQPIRDKQGSWVRRGWQAIEWVPGVADESRVSDVVRAGAAFHRAVAGLPRPFFIAASNSAWSAADRSAWGEAPWPNDDIIRRLLAEYCPIDAASQIIHGDLLGNVLFSPGRPPAVIDWAPYWRPPGYGAAIAVVDAACWHGYPLDLLSESHGYPQWRQLLLRALVFRLAALHLLGHWDRSQRSRHLPVAVAIIALAHS